MTIPPAQGPPASVRLLGGLDAFFNRLYGWRWNPLYQSGALAVVLLGVVSVTGLYLLVFYRIGTPYESVARISDQVWTGRWIRGLHRYASGALMVAVAVHALRMGVQRRSWGRRLMAWVTGFVLVGLVLVCGWTGYVMVWDVHGQALAVQGARLLDVLPLFPEPVARTFSGERELPAAFFFLNLFLHILIPVGMALVLWLHVSHLSRPVLSPGKAVVWGTVGLLTAAAVLVPAPLGERADLLRLPGEVPLDLYFGFWLPHATGLPAPVVWAVGGGVAAVLLLVPLAQRPRAGARPAPSVVNERVCTGCEQCYLDCPYDAIRMVDRDGGRTGVVARVDPDLCASCGICAGSCAPMGIGPPGRTGRDQLTELRTLLAVEGAPASPEPVPGGAAPSEPAPAAPPALVVVACDRGPRPGWVVRGAPGIRVHPVACAGSLHTSVIEGFLRGGASGVLVAACPPRDCWNREGARWLEARMFHDREAELQERVDRRRVGLVLAGPAEARKVRDALGALARRVRDLEAEAAEGHGDEDPECRRGGADARPPSGEGPVPRGTEPLATRRGT
jgi:coenzyme F420-reducing hydrogenase delta subunit/Pyruvate/2-oxoacid:ferredoxin oxidoreductase delta subunit